MQFGAGDKTSQGDVTASWKRYGQSGQAPPKNVLQFAMTVADDAFRTQDDESLAFYLFDVFGIINEGLVRHHGSVTLLKVRLDGSGDVAGREGPPYELAQSARAGRGYFARPL